MKLQERKPTKRARVLLALLLEVLCGTGVAQVELFGFIH